MLGFLGNVLPAAAVALADAGADGVIVSNHGGRQLESFRQVPVDQYSIAQADAERQNGLDDDREYRGGKVEEARIDACQRVRHPEQLLSIGSLDARQVFLGCCRGGCSVLYVLCRKQSSPLITSLERSMTRSLLEVLTTRSRKFCLGAEEVTFRVVPLMKKRRRALEKIFAISQT